KTGNFLGSLLGIRGAVPAEPMKLTVEPAPKAKGANAGDTKATEAKAKDVKAAPAAAKPAHAKAEGKPKASAKADANTDTKARAPAASTPAPDGAVQTTAIDPAITEPAKPKKALGPFRGGGNQAVCVRTCDGFFFPVNYEGAKSDDRYAEACANSCPASRTEVYFMPRGGDLRQAATASGERYTALDTAFRYRKERDASCSCKSDGQSWAEVLKPVDPLIKHGKDDVIVTPEKSLELARPSEPDLAKAEMIANAPQKSGKKASKKAEKREAKGTKPTNAQAVVNPGQTLGRSGPWRNTTKFMKADMEPTASIRTDAR
ncbi:MAG: DUF2865 domain-containing protein, partial [Proteobacteria bacterium]|nr:DUF2865 domain-containing protein [Pseudomonadota bacterium]